MATIAEQIKELEAEILKTQKNKATEFHIGKLKAKIAALKREQEKQAAQGGGGGVSYAVKKSGNATVGLIGLPSVGKSTILSVLTGKESEQAAYAFTTLTVIPGMLHHRFADIQVLDMPGIIAGASLNKGRGKEVIAAARNSDLILLTLDAKQAKKHLPVIIRELEQSAIRINRRPKDINLYYRDRGGINIHTVAKQSHLTDAEIESIIREFRINNADVVIRDDVTADDLVDHLAGNRVYIPAVTVVNKVDLVGEDAYNDLAKWLTKQGFPAIPMVANKGLGAERAKDFVYEALNFMQVFLKPRGEEADMEEPLIVKADSDVGMVCDILHRDFRRLFRYAQVWGPSGKFPGQTVGLDHVLQDGDVLSIVTRRT